MYYQTLLLIFVSISSILAIDEIQYGVGESLHEPQRIDLTSPGASLVLYVRYCKYSVSEDDFLYLRMTRFCYCTSETDDNSGEYSCSYPAPTLITKDNTQISITIINQLTGAESTISDTYWNHFKDMDTTNLHTHGLHVSPFEDDVLLKLEPNGDQHTYTYTYGYHYPGTFWYHAHHHGSVSLHLDGGLHGAFIMTSDDEIEQEISSKYDENILLFNWQYPIPKSECIPDAERGGSNSKLCPGRSLSNTNPAEQFKNRNILIAEDSMCFIYCQMPTFQLDASGFIYDLETDLTPDLNDQSEYETLYFTNGQLQPIIDDLQVGIFRRLRLINSIAQFYIQFKFPNECNAYQISKDGIYISTEEYMNYDLSSPSHKNELILAPGARADILIKCNEIGIYHIYSSQNNELDPQQLPQLIRIKDRYKLFSIKINERDDIIDGSDLLPMIYPPKLDGTYLETFSNTNTETECSCHRPLPNTEFDENSVCFYEFEETPINMVNGKQFDVRNSEPPMHFEDSLSIIEYNKAYEFIINNDHGHVYHQHVNPFLMTENVGNNAFIAFKNVWYDSFGNNGMVQKVKVRTWSRDYWGLVIMHCHLIEHEDTGMMGFYNIIQGNDFECPFDSYDSDGDSGSDSGSSAEWNQEISANNNHKSAIARLWDAKKMNFIAIGLVTIVLICGLFAIIIGICYRQRLQKSLSNTRTRIPTVENDSDSGSDESVSKSEGQIIEFVETHAETDNINNNVF